MSIVLGLGYTNHEMSTTLIRDGSLIVHISRERLSRFRHDGGRFHAPRSGFPWDISPCIRYCLDAAEVPLESVDLFVVNNMPNLDRDGFFRKIVSKSSIQFDRDRVRLISHHLAHAYSTYWSSGTSDAAVLVVDGQGNSLRAVRQYEGEDAEYANRHLPAGNAEDVTEKLTAYSVRNGEFVLIKKEFTNGSIGGAYLNCSWLIFGENEPGKTMGLAPFGLSDLQRGALLSVENGVIKYGYITTLPEYNAFTRPREWPPKVNDWTESNTASAALASRIQSDLEDVLVQVAREVRSKSGMKRLCLAGGVALNSVANRRIIEEGGFDDVFIVPAAGDDGISLGCAYWGAAQLGELKAFRMMTAAFGYSYKDEEIGRAIASDLRVSAERLPKPQLLARTARVLREGKIVAWFQGGSEMGPRALGNRSILADPTNAMTKDLLNLRVKFREPFRPFAPIVSESALSEYFDLDRSSPFMLIVALVHEAKRAALPAITHVDGSARIQTVSAEDGLIHELLGEFERLSGVPILVNTSLNVRGEPIAETPGDAVRVLLSTAIDVLVMGEWFCVKQELTDDQMRRGTLTIPNGSTLTFEQSCLEGQWSSRAWVTMPYGKHVEIDEPLLALITNSEPCIRVLDLVRPERDESRESKEAEVFGVIRRGLAMNLFGIS